MDFSQFELDFTSYKNVVFSLGTYEKNNYEQVFFPFIKLNHTIDDSIIYAIDPEYKTIVKNNSQTIQFNSLTFIYKFSKDNIKQYYCPEKNIQLFFISDIVPSDYPNYRHEAKDSFHYCRNCNTNNPKWISFFNYLKKLVGHRLHIYINNWIFTNTRYFKEINGVIKGFYNDIGHCFEYTPEIGFILYRLYEETNYNNIYITGLYKINNIYKHDVINLEQTDII